MAQLLQLSRPMVCATAGFQRNKATRLRGEKIKQVAATNPSAENLPTAPICPMGMENVLRNIEANYANFVHGRLPQVMFNDSPWHIDAVGGASIPSDCRCLRNSVNRFSKQTQIRVITNLKWLFILTGEGVNSR